MNWREVLLGDGIRIKHGYAFKGKHFVPQGDHIVLTPGNFHERGGFRLRPGKDRAYSGDIPESFMLSRGDLIIAMTEQASGLLGSSAIVPEDDRFLHNQRIGLVDHIDPAIFCRRYLYLLFNTRSVRHQIAGSASGTKVRHTAPGRVYRVKARVPDVPTQRRIADFLFNYDDLIENNRRRIQLLEQSARLLYKEWFVHLRFPGHEHQGIIGKSPKSWNHAPASQVIEINPKTPASKGSKIRYLPMAGLPEEGTAVDLSKLEVRTVSTSVRFRNGDVLFARITPCLENGKTALVNFLNDDEVGCGSTEFIVLRGKAVSSYFTYCLARSYAFRESAIKSMIGSSGRQRVQASCFDDFYVSVPPRILASEFGFSLTLCGSPSA